jgi:hypothetical protein
LPPPEPPWRYSCNILYKILKRVVPGIDEAATPKGKGVKVQTKTYTTEKEAKKAAARDYRPAIVRLPNGRYACFQAGDALPQGARAVSRWGTDRWHAYE